MRPDPSREHYLAFFEKSYDAVNYDKPSLAARVLGHGHTLLERAFGPETRFETVVEVGAGHGEHLAHVRHGFSRYIMTDWNADELGRRFDLPEWRDKGVEVMAQDATRLTLPDNSADRLIASHVLEHLPRPTEALRDWSRVVKDGGVISIALPCDPGFAWRLGRHFGPRRANHAAGNTAYDYWMAYEHVNAIQNLHTFLAYYFDRRDEIWFPLGVKSFNFNLIYVVHLRNDKGAGA